MKRENLTFISAIRKVLNYTKEYKKWYIISIILMILFILSEIITTMLISYAISNIISLNMKLAIDYIIIYLIISFIGLNILHFFHHKISREVSVYFSEKIQSNLYSNILKAKPKDFENLNIGELFTTVGSANERIIAFLTSFFWAATKLVYLLIVLVILFFMNIYVGLVASTSLLFLIILTFFYLNKNKRLTELEYNEVYQSNALLNQTVYGFKELRFFDSEIYSNKYKTVMKELHEIKKKKGNVWVIVNVLRWDIYKLTECGIMVLIIFLLINKQFAISQILLAVNYTRNILDIYFAHVLEHGIDIASFVKDIEKNMEILECRTIKPEHFGTNSLKNPSGKIRFENINYQYDNSIFKIEDINLEIFPKERTAIIGNSGAGKTTIFKLISHYYDNYSGNILIDGVDLRNLSREAFIENIAITYQEPFIFNLSIRENILLSNKDVTEEEFKKVCAQARLDEFVLQLPEKYDTIINDKSSNLSGGQKQRIAIARAMIKNSKILLFDEPTSALDKENREYMKEMFRMLCKDKTIIVITHDRELITDFEHVVEMKYGKVVSDRRFLTKQEEQ